MKKLLFILIVVFCVPFFVDAREGDIPPRPKPPRLVNILTSQPFLSSSEIQQLENKLVAFDDTTSNQIAIVVVDDLNGLEAYDFATELGQQWGVGRKGVDNGVVILLSLGGGKGNRDYFISVGYGLEGALPDLAIKRIEEKALLPHLISGDYYRALDETTDLIMLVAVGEYSFNLNENSGDLSTSEIIFSIIFILFFVVIILIAIKGGGQGGGSRSYSSGSSYGGGYSGGRSGGFGGFGGGSFGGGGAGGKW